MIENKTIFIAHNWLETSFNKQSVELAKFFSIHNRVFFLNAHKRGKAKEKINEQLFVCEWPGKKPVTFKDFLFAFKLMKKHPPDMIISNFSANNIMLLVSWLLQVEVRVCYYHTLVAQYIADKGKLDSRQKFNIWRKRFIFKKATHIVAPSVAAKEDLLYYYQVEEKRITVLPNALHDYNKINNASEKVAGFVGRLHRSKGADILIEAFAILNKEMPGVKLKIAGRGNELTALVELVNRLGLSGSVEFTGALTNEEVIDFLTSITCLVVPSRADNQPTTILEALSTATPVIASNSGGIPEMMVNEKDGVLFENESVEDLYRQLKRIFADEVFRKRLSENARKTFVEKYNLNSWMQQFEKLLS